MHFSSSRRGGLVVNRTPDFGSGEIRFPNTTGAIVKYAYLRGGGGGGVRRYEIKFRSRNSMLPSNALD